MQPHQQPQGPRGPPRYAPPGVGGQAPNPNPMAPGVEGQPAANPAPLNPPVIPVRVNPQGPAMAQGAFNHGYPASQPNPVGMGLPPYQPNLPGAGAFPPYRAPVAGAYPPPPQMAQAQGAYAPQFAMGHEPAYPAMAPQMDVYALAQQLYETNCLLVEIGRAQLAAAAGATPASQPTANPCLCGRTTIIDGLEYTLLCPVHEGSATSSAVQPAPEESPAGASSTEASAPPAGAPQEEEAIVVEVPTREMTKKEILRQLAEAQAKLDAMCAEEETAQGKGHAPQPSGEPQQDRYGKRHAPQPYQEEAYERQQYGKGKSSFDYYPNYGYQKGSFPGQRQDDFRRVDQGKGPKGKGTAEKGKGKGKGKGDGKGKGGRGREDYRPEKYQRTEGYGLELDDILDRDLEERAL